LVDKSSTFFPTTISFICGCKGCIEEFGSGFESFDMSGGESQRKKTGKGK
jgi:hypothetical protein